MLSYISLFYLFSTGKTVPTIEPPQNEVQNHDCKPQRCEHVHVLLAAIYIGTWMDAAVIDREVAWANGRC